MTQHPAIRLFILLVSGAVALSALGGLVAASLQSPAILFMAALEACVLVCAVFGLLIGRGRFIEGRALALLCVGAGIAVATELGTRGAFERSIAGVSLWPLIFARFGVGAAFMVLAALEVLMRRPRESWRRLGIGCALALPVLIAGAALTRPAVKDALGSIGGLGQLVLSLAGFALICGLLAASGHYLVTAFAVGVEAGEQSAGKPA